MTEKLYTMNPEFPGYWSKKQSSNSKRVILRFDVILTLIIFGLVSLEILYNLSIITVATLVLTSVSTIILLLNYEKYPLVTVPSSQIIVLLLVGYIHLVITESLVIKFIPEPINLILGALIAVRIFIGMYIIRLHLHYSKARVPVSKSVQESLKLFETHLKLIETRKDNFKEEPLSILFLFLRNISAIFLVLGFLLFPLWLNMFFNILIYPYILLIPSLLLLLFVFVIYLQKAN